jgi:hypothetical protein
MASGQIFVKIPILQTCSSSLCFWMCALKYIIYNQVSLIVLGTLQWHEIYWGLWRLWFVIVRSILSVDLFFVCLFVKVYESICDLRLASCVLRLAMMP